MQQQAEGVDVRALVELNRRAVTESVRIVGFVRPDQLALQTPCADWDLGRLLSHMIAQHRGFTAAARGKGDDLSVWRESTTGHDPVPAYTASAGELIEAFAADDIEGRSFHLPEVRNGGPFPASLAIAFHLVDYVAHGWDVARSIGVETAYPGAVIRAALRVAAAIPDGDERLAPGAAFAPAVAAPGDAAPDDAVRITGSGEAAGSENAAADMDQLLRILGRDPGWSPRN